MKKFILGMIVGGVISLSSSSFANDAINDIKLLVKPDLPIIYNEQKLNLENSPLNYNGRTYLQLRELSAFLGKGIRWDGNRVILSDLEKNVAHLPDGRVLIRENDQEPLVWGGITWRNSPVRVYNSTREQPNFDSTLGNHRRIIEKEQIQIPAGNAYLVYIARDKYIAGVGYSRVPNDDLYEYRIVMFIDNPDDLENKSQDVYSLVAELNNVSKEAVKEKIIQVAQTWNPGR